MCIENFVFCFSINKLLVRRSNLELNESRYVGEKIMAPAELKRNVPDGVFYSELGGRLLVFSQKSLDRDFHKDMPDMIKESLKNLLVGCEVSDVLVRSDSENVSVMCWAEAESSFENKRKLKNFGAVAI